MKKHFLILVVCLTTVFYSCNQSSDSRDYSADESVVETASKLDAMVEPEKALENVDRKLIKEGFLEFETKDLNKTRQNIVKAVQQYKGYTSTDQEFTSPGKVSITINVRIPSQYFDSALTEIVGDVKKFDRKEVFIKDVTEEFMDIEARLKTKKELESRYLELLKQTGKINEIMEIERELSQLRSDVESIEGRYKYLSNQVVYSTLNITFYKTSPIYVSVGNKIAEGFAAGWNNLMLFFVFLVNLWPFLLIISAVIFWRIRNKKQKNAELSQPKDE